MRSSRASRSVSIALKAGFWLALGAIGFMSLVPQQPLPDTGLIDKW